MQVTPVPVRTLRDERRGQELPPEILAEALRREVQRVVRRDFELEDAPGPRDVAVVVGAPTSAAASSSRWRLARASAVSSISRRLCAASTSAKDAARASRLASSESHFARSASRRAATPPLFFRAPLFCRLPKKKSPNEDSDADAPAFDESPASDLATFRLHPPSGHVSCTLSIRSSLQNASFQ